MVTSEYTEDLGNTEKQICLDAGELVPVDPEDNCTADGLAKWENDEPLYHDLEFESYVNFDLQEWVGRLKKYKREFVNQAQRVSRLTEDIKNVKYQLEGETGNFGVVEVELTAVRDELEVLTAQNNAASKLRDSLDKEIRTLGQNLRECKPKIEGIDKAMKSCDLQIARLVEELDNSSKHFTQTLGHKEVLKLEREWFMRERILLEETVEHEARNTHKLRESVEKLRHCMQKAWREAKEYDNLGHLRATKLTRSDPRWYDARRRKFGHPFTRGEASHATSKDLSEEG